MGLEAVVGGLFGLASAGISAASAHHTQSANAAAQSEINQATMDFNRIEAAKARDWQAQQAAIDRQFSSAQQVNVQNFNASQAAKAMGWSSNEAALARQFNAKESALARQFNANEAALGRKFNAEQSYLARQFEERMSSTAHQREVQDLRKAGLNPILSATGGNGASSPVAPILSSPVASSSPVSSPMGSSSAASSSVLGHSTPGAAAAHIGALNAYMKKDVLGQFVNSALDSMRVANDYTRAKAQDKEADAAVKNAETNRLRQVADEKHIKQQIETLKADERWKDFMAKTESEKVNLVKEQIISEKLRQGNEKRLTDAKVAEAGAIAYQAVKNADTEAAYKAVLSKMAVAHDANEKKRLGFEAQELKYKYETGQRKLERDWIEKHPYWAHTLTTIDKVMGAVSPIKLKPLKE